MENTFDINAFDKDRTGQAQMEGDNDKPLAV
jgi:hypothetical protein